MLTGFKEVENVADRDKKTTISERSRFLNGVKFTITGHTYKHPEIDGKVRTDISSPVLISSIGDVFLSMLTRKHVSVSGEILSPDGTFNKKVEEILTTNLAKSDGEILTAIEKSCKGKTLIVRRKAFVGKTSDGRDFPASMVNIDFAE